jgi:hypothetical protein
MNRTKTKPVNSGAETVRDQSPMMDACCKHGLTPRYISLRARKLPRVKRPAFIWLDDTPKGGRGPDSYHQEFLSALLEFAGEVFIIHDRIPKDQTQNAIDAAVKTGCAVVVFTTNQCAADWEQAAKVTSSQTQVSMAS